ncbi:hypothetical protein [Mycobacterium asiaticum]|uniref:Uncharacterized protein n=1 Tax=Mycobacterium asiaticum TaxID=1790 RepID=A0A1A3KPM3_MYCAS|nr:hypothetical protein [Mycobacterium asiaticum]OBJ86965.1 hypothetical protein A5640_08795 [Mycobacterium asiaticum]
MADKLPLSTLLITGLLNRPPRCPELSRLLTDGLLSKPLRLPLLSTALMLSNDQNLWMSLGEAALKGRTFPRMI